MDGPTQQGAKRRVFGGVGETGQLILVVAGAVTIQAGPPKQRGQQRTAQSLTSCAEAPLSMCRAAI